MSDTNKDDFENDIDDVVDDLDFSDIDLGNDAFDADSSDDHKTGGGKKDYTSYIVYGLTGLIVLGIAAWQLDLFGGNKEADVFRADNVPVNTEIAADADNLLPASNDPFNVLGTPETIPQAAPEDTAMIDSANAEAQSPLMLDAMQPSDSMALDTNGLDQNAQETLPRFDSDPLPTATTEGAIVPLPEQQPVDISAIPSDNAAELNDVSVVTEAETSPTPAQVEQVPVSQAPEPTPLVEQEPTPTPEPAVVMDAQAQAPNAELQAIMSTLDTITARLDAIELSVAEKSANVPSNAVSNEEIKALKDTVAALESKISQSEQPRANDAPKAQSVAKKAPAKKSSTATKKKSTSKWDQPYDGGAVLENKSVTQPVSNSSTYMLRAAQPNKAYIADQSGTMLEVTTGTAIPNMGQVTSITQTNGQWMITTTGGVIK